jgi:hypothetical protein
MRSRMCLETAPGPLQHCKHSESSVDFFVWLAECRRDWYECSTGIAVPRHLLKLPKWDLIRKLIVLDTVPVLLCVLAFRSTRFEPLGYRFSLDFLP